MDDIRQTLKRELEIKKGKIDEMVKKVEMDKSYISEIDEYLAKTHDSFQNIKNELFKNCNIMCLRWDKDDLLDGKSYIDYEDLPDEEIFDLFQSVRQGLRGLQKISLKEKLPYIYSPFSEKTPSGRKEVNEILQNYFNNTNHSLYPDAKQYGEYTIKFINQLRIINGDEPLSDG